MRSERDFTGTDARALGISTDDLNACFEHKMTSKKTDAVRQSTQTLAKDAPKDKVVYDFSGLDLKEVDKEILSAKMTADQVRLISALQAKVKLKVLTTVDRKKVLLELLLELLNARKLHLIEDHLYKYRDLVALEVDEQDLSFRLAFSLLEIIVGCGH